MHMKSWVVPSRRQYDAEEMLSVAMEALSDLNTNSVLDIDGEQMFDDLETLSNLKSIATEQLSDSHLDYAGMLCAVNDIKSRWFLPPSVGLESSSCPRTAFIQEVDIAMEGIAANIVGWFGSKFKSMWKSLKNLFNVSEQVKAWLDENESSFNDLAAGKDFVLKWKMYYGYLVINNKLDIPKHIDVAKQGRELSQLAEEFYAKTDPSNGYQLDMYEFDAENKKLERVAMKADTAAAIKATPRNAPLHHGIDVIALPGNVYISTGRDAGIYETVWTAIAFDKASDTIKLTSNDTKRMIDALHKLTETASKISFKSNKEQDSVKKAEAEIEKYWDKADSKESIEQLRRNVRNAINYEMAISASITRTLLGLHMAALQALKQAKK